MMRVVNKAFVALAVALLATVFVQAPGAANGSPFPDLPDLPTPHGAPSATLVKAEIEPDIGGPATCAFYVQRRGDDRVHWWQFCAYLPVGDSFSYAGTSRLIDDPDNPGASHCETNRKQFFDAEFQTLDLTASVNELGGDQGDFAEFFPSGEFTHEVCFYEWAWSETDAEPLRRFW